MMLYRERRKNMDLNLMVNVWSDVVAHPGAVNDIEASYYLSLLDYERILPFVKSCGYSGIEIFDGNIIEYEGREKEFTSMLDSAGLKLKAVYTGGKFIFKEILPIELKKINNVIELSLKLGAEYLVVGGGTILGPERSEDIKKLGEGLEKVNDAAEASGIKAVYHPHLGSLVETAQQIDEVMSYTSMKLVPDLGHIMGAGSDPVKVVEKYLSRIPYIHFKDFRDGNFLPPCDGDIDFSSIAGLLKSGPGADIAVEVDGAPGTPENAALRGYLNTIKLFS